MSKIEQIKCDFCGHIKAETNHWYRLGIDDDGELIIIPPDCIGHPFNDDIFLDACGEKCVLSGVQKFLEKRTLTD